MAQRKAKTAAKPAPPPEAMVTVTINDKAIQVPNSLTVFQAAERAGIAIPHYCYHPDLSIAGQCRMCLVEVEKIPRLQISCNTKVADGMVVRTNTDKVKDTVKGVLELHLINHPIDCPICDKAGECRLQDLYSGHGLYASRMEYEKVHKPKVQDIGTIVLDSERCILCSRCVRFTSEVSKSNELTILNRGDRSELCTYDGGPLKNDYTGNLADICPVGALTAKDFRFQCRVWFLDKVDSVCTLCARGCNTEISVKENTKELYRVEPRRNPKVNKSWICDQGRWDFHYVKDEQRLRVPRQKIEGRWTEYPWEHVYRRLHKALEADPTKILVALSSHLTNEELWDLIDTLRGMGVSYFTRVADEAEVGKTEPADGILKHSDRTPNASGFDRVAKALGVKPLSVAQVKQAFAKECDTAWFVGLEGEDPPGVKALIEVLPKETKLLFHASNELPYFEMAETVLPNATGFEKSGTMVNALGRLQKVRAAVAKRFTARDGYQMALGLREGNDRSEVAEDHHAQLFDAQIQENIVKFPATWEALSPMGVPLGGSA